MASAIWILEGARTAMRRFLGDFAATSAIDLCAAATRAAIERAAVSPEVIEHVVVGNAQQTSLDAIYGARHVALRAGIPESVPALTVNRLCGSGIQSIISVAHAIASDGIDVGVAGGMENMSMAPHVLYGGREGLPHGCCVARGLADSGVDGPLLWLHHVSYFRQSGAQVRHQPRRTRCLRSR